MQVEYIGAIDNSSRNPDAVTEKYVENYVKMPTFISDLDRKS